MAVRIGLSRKYKFGSGSRACIVNVTSDNTVYCHFSDRAYFQGRHISMMEISKLLPTLLRRYHFTPTPRSFDSPHRFRHGCSPSGTVSPVEPVYIKPSAFLGMHVSCVSLLIHGHHNVFTNLGLLVHGFVEVRSRSYGSGAKRKTMITSVQPHVKRCGSSAFQDIYMAV